METTPEPARSSTGLDENVAAVASYLLFFGSGIVFLVLERQSSYVRFHALQSTVAFLVLTVAWFVGGLFPLIGGLLRFLVASAWVILWLILMFQAYRGERYKLPFVGDIAEERAALPGGESEGSDS